VDEHVAIGRVLHGISVLAPGSMTFEKLHGAFVLLCGATQPWSLLGPRTAAPLRLPKQRTQLVFGAFERPSSLRWQVLARAVEIEGQHRHGRSVRRRTPPSAPFCRALQRARDLPRILAHEHAGLEIEGVTRLRNAARPASRGSTLRRWTFLSLFDRSMSLRLCHGIWKTHWAFNVLAPCAFR
jgi:hypothetical protein